MELHFWDKPRIIDPAREDIVVAIGELGSDLYDFIILQQTEMTYIQAAWTPDGGFRVEYQDGDASHRFVADSGTIGEGQIVECFLAYLAGEECWRDVFTWKRETS